jgi:hypothetical protein
VNWRRALFGWVRTDAVNVELGVAAGRDIRDSTIHVGLDEKEVGQRIDEAQRPINQQLATLASQIAREKGVEIAPLRAILGKLGEAEVPDHEIPARLGIAADELIELRMQLTRLNNDRPEFASIRNEALTYIDRGEFDAARASLARGREAARALRENVSRNEAEFLADEARIDHLQLAYRAAAEKYSQATGLVTSFDRVAGWQYLMKEADELFAQGREFGENQALLEATSVYRSALTLVPQARAPLDWAKTQTNLGNALCVLGERGDDDALREAVAAYEAALLERARERVPLDWTATQNNLGAALGVLGARGDDEALRQAVAACEAAPVTVGR